MTELSTSRIYTYDSNSGISTRDGSLALDSAEVYVAESDERDALRPLHVDGLLPSDMFVFLDVGPKNIGYIVGSAISPEGSGVIVPGDLVVSDTRTFLGPEMAERLSSLDYPTLAEFGLPSLARAIYERRASN